MQFVVLFNWYSFCYYQELSRESQAKNQSQRTVLSGGNEVSFHSGGFPYHQDPSENEVTFTKPASANRMRSALAENDVSAPSASTNRIRSPPDENDVTTGSRNMSALDVNDVTFQIPRKSGAAVNPEHVSAAHVTTTKVYNKSVHFKNRTLDNAANQVQSNLYTTTSHGTPK